MNLKVPRSIEICKASIEIFEHFCFDVVVVVVVVLLLLLLLLYDTLFYKNQIIFAEAMLLNALKTVLILSLGFLQIFKKLKE